MKHISVVINTKNSADTLDQALRSVSWSDDIIVVDMGSTDDTKKIAEKYTRHIFDFNDVGYVEPARNFAINKAKNDWVLVLDADEEVSKEFVNNLEKLTQDSVDVYDIPRKNIMFGRWMQHAGSWPDYQRRLFKKNAVVWSDAIHSIPKVTGTIKKLEPVEKLAIIHHHYQTIEQYIDRLNRYTSVEAKQLKGHVTSQAKILEQGFSELFSRYFKEQGYKDELHGLSVTFLQMFYQVTTQLKIWQHNKFEKSADTITNIFPKIIMQMNYWYADYRVKTAKNPFVKAYWYMKRRLAA